jgi:adenylate cyclase
MSSGQPLRQRVLHLAREYVTHWFIAGAVVALTGVAPDHWVAHILHAVQLDGLLGALPAADYRLIAVAIGVSVCTLAVIFQNQRMHKKVLAAVIPAAPAQNVANDGGELINGKLSIAVLPFVNMSSDPEKEYFADGLTEDITTGLSLDSRLFVVSRNSAFTYKGKPVDSRTVGRELGVRYVLEGSIRPVGGQLRIAAQLIDTTSGAHVWADKIDRPMAEIFAISDEVANGLVTALASNLGIAEGKRAARARPEDLQAWALCVQAEVLFFGRYGPEYPVLAEKLLRRASKIEPAYAVSWAFLSYLIAHRVLLGLSQDAAADTVEAKVLADKALSLAPQDPAVLGFCGWALLHTGQIARAIGYLEHSLELNPCNAVAQIAYGAALLFDERPGEAIAQLDYFLRLSPKDPLAYFAYFFRAYCYLSLGDYHSSVESARKALMLNPSFANIYIPLAYSLVALGRMDEARQQMQKYREKYPRQTLEALENFYQRTQSSGKALEIIAGLRRVWQD